jgi:hypothetical protein
MKLILKLFLFVFLFFVAAIIFGLGYMGYIPAIANLLGTNKPKDLGVKYSESDNQAAIVKNGVKYEALTGSITEQQSIVRSGKHPVDTSFTSSEVTALMNYSPWKYWPYRNTQVRFNSDGTTEISGGLDKSIFPSYASYMGIPEEATQLIMKLLPPTPIFYIKTTTSLKDNKINQFNIQALHLNNIPLPINLLLSNQPKLIHEVNAQISTELLNDLGKVNDKRGLVIEFINNRLNSYSSFFYASEARAEENKLIFKGSLPDREASVR